MERQPHGIRALAEKYLDQALVADRRVEDRQSIVEPRIIIIKTESVAPDLSGRRGWQFTLTKKGQVPDRGEPVVYASLSPLDLLYWAKRQTPATLRGLLAEQGIAATGSSTYILAGLLTYAYEEKLGKAAGTWPLPPEQMAHRMRRLAAFRRYKDQKGGMSDEGLIVAINQLMLHGVASTIILEERSMAKRGDQPPEIEETASQIRERLKREAKAQEEGNGEPDEPGNGEVEELEPATTGAQSESQAIRSGKRKPAPEPAAPAQPKAGGKKGPVAKPAVPAAAAEKEETTVATATKAKGKGKVKAKAPTGAGRNGAGGASDLAKKFPIGAKVKYIGTRVAEHTGKVAEITGHRGSNGIAFKFKDGKVGTATPGALELLK